MLHLQQAAKVLLYRQIQMFQLRLKEMEMEVIVNKVLNKIHSHREILNHQVEEVLKDRIILKELIPKEEMPKVDSKIIMVLKELIPKEEMAKVDSKIIMVLKELILKQETDKMDNKTILMVQMVYPVEKELLHKSYRTKQENLEKLLLM